MCRRAALLPLVRWLVWVGKNTVVSNLIFGARHSLATQSEAAGYTPGCAEDHRRNHAVNVHGCGIGWYGHKPGEGLVDGVGLSSYERPAVYTTTAAPSHDRNLRSLAKMIETGLLFGHVRAAGPGASVHEYNCHPFTCGRYLFMHNGNVANFQKLRRALLERLRDCLFEWLSGTTDSELLFALFLNQLPDVVTLQPPEVLAAALKATIRLVVEAAGGEPSSINVACTDGESVLATRFRNGAGETPPSLYYHTGALPGASWDLPSSGGLGGLTSALNNDGLLVNREPSGNSASMPQLSSSYDGGGISTLLRRASFERREPHPRQSLLVASEPLSEDGADWRMFPANTMLVATPRWRGGERDGERALRCELQDSAQASDEPTLDVEEEVVVLDLRFESLEVVAALTSPLLNAPAGASAAAELPPRCPPRASRTASGWSASAHQSSTAPELDFSTLSFN